MQSIVVRKEQPRRSDDRTTSGRSVHRCVLLVLLLLGLLGDQDFGVTNEEMKIRIYELDQEYQRPRLCGEALVPKCDEVRSYERTGKCWQSRLSLGARAPLACAKTVPESIAVSFINVRQAVR